MSFVWSAKPTTNPDGKKFYTLIAVKKNAVAKEKRPEDSDTRDEQNEDYEKMQSPGSQFHFANDNQR